MIGLLLEINACCALLMFGVLTLLERRGFFAGRLGTVETLALSAIWPIALLLVAAEWALQRRHR